MQGFDHPFILQSCSKLLRSIPDASVQPFRDVSTDSRTTKPGDLFVAIKGELADGHDFIDKAISAGARAIMLDQSGRIPQNFGGAVYLVNDSLAALRAMTRLWRQSLKLPVIGVAGSVGKTTVKDMIAAILRGRFAQVLKTEQSQNGFLGIPMTLARMESSTDVAVIEIGIDEPHAMAQHWDVVQPDIAILTAIGPEHLEGLGSMETVVHEESLSLTLTTDRGGRSIINWEDPLIAGFAEKLPPEQCFSYAMNPDGIPAGFRSGARNLTGSLTADGASLVLRGCGLDGHTMPLLMPGRHNAINQLGAITVCRALGLTWEEILQGAAQFQASPGRSARWENDRGLTVIRDYYNANPTSMLAAFDLVKDEKKRRPDAPLIVCLGDMLELGSGEEAFHRQLAPEIISRPIDQVLCLGPRMKWLVDELKKLNFAKTVMWFENHEVMGSYLRPQLQQPAILLLKGSRGMRMEKVWEMIERDLSQ